MAHCSLGGGRPGGWFLCLVVPMSLSSHGSQAPSRWIEEMLVRYAAGAADAIDLASGSGRHAHLLARQGLSVVAIDVNPAVAEALQSPGITFQQADLEQTVWPLAGWHADVVVVSNYLYRPHLDRVADLVRVGGLLIYETFGVGNAAFGHPSNPEFLLRDGELEARFSSQFAILDQFFGAVSEPKPAIRGRFCGRRRG